MLFQDLWSVIIYLCGLSIAKIPKFVILSRIISSFMLYGPTEKRIQNEDIFWGG